MKFRALVALTALALFLLFFFLGLSSGSDMNSPSQNSLMYKLFKGTVLVMESSREAVLTVVLQVQDALDLSIIGVNKTTKIVKEAIKPAEPENEKAIEAALEAMEEEAQPPAQPETKHEPTVLLYNGQNISTQPVFEAQMQYLAANQYVTITVPEIASPRSAENSAKLVVLTFEMGFKDFYDKAFPVLQKHNLKATIFVPDSYSSEAMDKLVIDAFLRKGSSGSKTKQLQQKLNNFGYLLQPDGFFGAYTMAKVIDFQRTNALLVDGIVGPQTTGQINKLVTELQAIQNSELVVIMNPKPKLTNELYIPENYPVNDFSTLLQASQVEEKSIPE